VLGVYEEKFNLAYATQLQSSLKAHGSKIFGYTTQRPAAVEISPKIIIIIREA